VLPTRSSGMTDIFANTLGTALGAMFWRWSPVQAVFARMGRYTASPEHHSAEPAADGIEIGSA
jgi:hypothetical protein